MRKTLLYVGILAISMFLLVGCAPSTPPDDTADKTAIGLAVDNWRMANEGYTVSAMLAPLTSDFTLDIKEKGVSQGPKDLTTLTQEIQGAATNQAKMRSEGYSIAISFTDATTTITSATAKYAASFTTGEKVVAGAETLAGTIIPENGTIGIDLVKADGVWKFSKMDLDFNP